MKQNCVTNHYDEPLYDDWSLEQMDNQQTEELVAGLVEYCRRLEKQVVGLRFKMNQQTQASSPVPYPEPHGDLYENFEDYIAYPKFKHIFESEDV